MSSLSEFDLNAKDVPRSMIKEFSAIAVERGVKQDGLIKTAVISFVEAAGVIPPEADEIVEKLQKVQREFKEYNLIHLNLIG